MSAGSLPSGSQVKDPGYPTPSENYLTNSKGVLSWVFTLDHKRIGVMYLIGVTVAFGVAGLLALLIRLHLFRPDGMIFQGPEANNWYNQVFTLHGAIMVFLFIIPSVPAALGNFLVPV
ncbi:MAG: cbb3-type cytochrome c oxidase subunit I, partial [Pirellulales bacterium]